MNKIKLEPDKDFSKAVVKRERGLITYSYYKLIDVCMEIYELDYNDATEWVDYNIVRLAPYGFKISYKR
jgi:hypothetical protein